MQDNSSQSMQPTHDQFFRAIFCHPKQAAGLLRFALPSDATASLDLDHLVPLPESFVNSLGGEGRADLLFHCPVSGTEEELLVAVLFEHKSHPDREVLLQMARYWANLILKDRAMPVLPVLFYHGEAIWHPIGFKDLFPALPPALRRYQPNFPVAFIDMARQEDTGIWQHKGLDAITKIGLAILKNIFAEESKKSKAIDALISHLPLVPREARPEILRNTFLYLFSKSKVPTQKLEEYMDRVPEALHTPYKTWAEALIERGEARGREKGAAEGKAELVAQMLANGADWGAITQFTGITMQMFAQMQNSTKG